MRKVDLDNMLATGKAWFRCTNPYSYRTQRTTTFPSNVAAGPRQIAHEISEDAGANCGAMQRAVT
jgi:hypothetical protein